MKPRSMLALVVLAVMLVISYLVWFLEARAPAREWPSVQMRRAVALGLALTDYHNQHGTYPESLAALVNSGQISEDKFRHLQFQDTPQGDRHPWVYHAPVSISDIAIVSPRSVIPWAGSRGVYITARPDGGGEMIGANKFYIIESRLKRQTEQGAALQPPPAELSR